MFSMMNPCPLHFRARLGARPTAGLVVVVVHGLPAPGIPRCQKGFDVIGKDPCCVGPVGSASCWSLRSKMRPSAGCSIIDELISLVSEVVQAWRID